MKSQLIRERLVRLIVAPFAGAWIEIMFYRLYASTDGVAPFAGAWIEIGIGVNTGEVITVAPFAGAWIEIGIH